MDWFEELVSELEMTKTEVASLRESASSRILSSTRLDFLLDKLDLRNVQLARSLKIDSSLVSRWRSGERKLHANNPLHETLLSYFSKIIFPLGETLELSSTDLFCDAERFSLVLFYWLFPLPGAKQMTPFAINSLLNQVLRLTRHMPNLAVPSRSELETLVANNKYVRQYFTSPSSSSKRHYQGLAGLRAAVVRFLFEVIYSEETCCLKLFSNQSLSWLMDDKDFAKVWAMLMQVLLQQGHEIEIIHCLQRSPLEVVQGIKSWLPIYMMGKITPYSPFFNTTQQSSDLLVRTLFINSGKSAIVGNLFAGMEDQSIYQFVRQKNILTSLEAQFDYLKARSVRMGHSFRGSKAIEESKRSLASFFQEEATDLSLLLLSAKLPIALIPPDLFSSLISADSNFHNLRIGETERENLYQIFTESKRALKDFLSRGNELHLVLSQTPSTGKFRLDFFPHIDIALPLKADHYALIWDALLETCSQKRGVHLYPLAEPPFPALTLLVFEGTLVHIFFETEDPFILEMRGAGLAEAFAEYIRYFMP